MFQILDDQNRCETTFIVRPQPPDGSMIPNHSAIHNAGKTLEDTLTLLARQATLIHQQFGTGVFRILIDSGAQA